MFKSLRYIRPGTVVCDWGRGHCRVTNEAYIWKVLMCFIIDWAPGKPLRDQPYRGCLQSMVEVEAEEQGAAEVMPPV